MPFIPLHDQNPIVSLHKPWVTWGLIALCTAIFAVQLSLGLRAQEKLVYGLGLIPATLLGDARLDANLYLLSPWLTLITYPFLHGSPLHLLSNMLFLWIFGDNIEDSMGHGRFIVFYLLGGIAAGLTQSLIDPGARFPTIGASGAVAAVLGAYLVLHPRAKVLVPIIIIPLYIPAVFLLLIWIGYQVYTVAYGVSGNVAWWAHIGGFVTGALLIVPFRHNSLPLFGGDNLPTGLRVRRSYRRTEPERDPNDD